MLTSFGVDDGQARGRVGEQFVELFEELRGGLLGVPLGFSEHPHHDEGCKIGLGHRRLQFLFQ